MMLDRFPELSSALGNEAIQLHLRPRYRDVGLRRIDYGRGEVEDRFVNGSVDLMTTVSTNFCPFSGKPLPGPLDDQYVDIVRNELGLHDYSVFEDCPDLPLEFRSDAWWKARGLGDLVTNHVCKEDWKPPEVRPVMIPGETDTWVEGVDEAGVHHIEPWLFFLPPGYLRPRGLADHGCDAMIAALSDVREMIAYLPWTREYGIRVIDPNIPVDNQILRIVPIQYCPWCGGELPKSLRPEWVERFADSEFQPKPPDVDARPPTLAPRHLATDDWWRKPHMYPATV